MRRSILTIESQVQSSDYGGKAYWLSWLHQNGYNVPYAIFLPALDIDNINEIIKDQSHLSYLRELMKPFAVGNRYDVAVRSSATCEDAFSKSFAGHFKTFIDLMTFEEVMENAELVIKSLKDISVQVPCRMGVIIQKRIEPIFSGIAFSSNPVTGAKFQCVVSVTHGIGADLVSGRISGEDILLTKDEDSLQISHYTINIDKHYLEKIWEIGKGIENKLGYPVDVEWCIEMKSGKLYILQCRPATGVLWEGDPIILISIANEKILPVYVSRNEKVALRLIGERTGVLVSRAWLVIINCVSNCPEIPDLSMILPTSGCKGFSVVLIYPENLSGKVVRSFIGRRELAQSIFKGCQRYCIRTYPEYNTLKDCIFNIVQMCSKYYWTTVMIIQEIFDPKYAGIVKRISDGYVIELAKGHFIPKGIVPTSQYTISFNDELLYSSEVYQDKCYRIFEGHILEEKINPQESLVSVPKEILLRIIQDFKPFLNNEQTIVEFGLLENVQENKLCPYLIDFVEDKSSVGLDSEDISNGIISKGMVMGKLVLLEENEIGGDAFDLHFHDKTEQRADVGDSYIFLCKRPNISLLKFIQKHNPQQVGFIFREGSILCHTAIILREKGIPAIIMDELQDISFGEIVTVDAITPGLSKKERVRRHDTQSR